MVAGWSSPGVADIRTKQPATPAHQFRTASNTKAFTAAVVLQLVGAGKLQLDAPIRQWLPYMPDGVSIRQLLNHTRSLYDPTNELAFWAPYLRGIRWFVHRPNDIVAAALTRPLASDTYSNTNYLALGLLIEKVTGQSAGHEIEHRILRRLDLTETTFPTIDPLLHGRHLHGYDLKKRTDFTVFSPSYDWTAGAIVSTAGDLARFYRALFDGTLLKPAELAELTRVDGDYGLGVEPLDLDCPQGMVRVWGNSGGGPGYSSYALLSPDTSRQLVLVGTIYDIVADVQHQRPFPKASLDPVLRKTFC